MCALQCKARIVARFPRVKMLGRQLQPTISVLYPSFIKVVETKDGKMLYPSLIKAVETKNGEMLYPGFMMVVEARAG